MKHKKKRVYIDNCGNNRKIDVCVSLFGWVIYIAMQLAYDSNSNLKVLPKNSKGSVNAARTLGSGGSADFGP